MNRHAVEDVYELSPLQQGLLFHTLYTPDAGVYFEQISYTIQGQLNVVALQAAWQEVMQWHPVLRTAFLWEDVAKPLQVVYRQVALPWAYYDWRADTPVAQAAQLAAFLHADRAQGFDLLQPPPMRLSLIQVADDTYHFVWSFHHLLLDGWSVALLFKQVFTCYQACCRGTTAAREWSRPYRDYIIWLQQQDLAAAEVFWRERLKGFTAPTPLGLDRPAEAEAGAAGYAEQRCELIPATVAALRELSRQHGLTLNTVVQGAWAVLLSYYSGMDEVVFGATIAGRSPDLVGVELMVGLFINTLPVRVDVAPRASLLAWLQQLQDEQAEARQYEHSPLAHVQGWCEVPRSQPLFESIVVFENYSIEQIAQSQRDGTDLRLTDARSLGQTNYPLTIAVLPQAGVRLWINYDCRRFTPATIERMLGHLQTLLAAMAAHPDQRLVELPILTSAEQQQLTTWNTTDVACPWDTCVQQLFEAQAARTPDAIALVFDGSAFSLQPSAFSLRLTYRELNARANQLAQYLRRHGVGREVRVALCIDRSLELVIGLLGILKAGGAYVPLDADNPPDRLAFMLADAQALVLLTQTHLLAQIPLHQVRVVCLDRDWGAIALECVENPVHAVDGEQLAYVIYTSGSTGRPKAVMVQHRNLLNTLTVSQQQFDFQPDDVVPWIASVTFDIALFELLNPLLAGGTAMVLTRQQVLDLPHLCATMTDCTIFHAVPSLMKQIVQTIAGVGPGTHDYARLRMICVGGDVVPAPLLAEMQAVFPMANICILYGPTEATIICARYLVPRDQRITRALIGRLLPHMRARLYDRHGRLVSIGVVGELYLDGAGITRGYLNRPDLTAERFVPNPFAEVSGIGYRVLGAEPSDTRYPIPDTRLYKTGDRARYLPDGTLEFLGRLDGQVKVRGFRIETGEIAAVLGQHPAVHEALVLARADASGEQRLIAYVVPTKDERRKTKEAERDRSFVLRPSSFVQELRDHLGQTLPDYMIPAAVVLLDTLPLTAHGKVDQRALPLPDGGRPHMDTPLIAPRTPQEELIADIWAQVLGLAQVGIHDNFFTLGGHSLLATQVISRIRSVFNCDIPLRQLFESPTVAALATSVIRGQGSAPGAQALRPVGRDQAPPLSFAQQRLWFLDLLQPHNAAYNMPMAVRLNGALNVPALRTSLYAIVQRHEALRTSFTTQDERPVQVIAPTLHVPLVVVDLQYLQSERRAVELERLITAEGHQPFDLVQGPLLRTTLVQLDATMYTLLITMHHIISDGWSMSIFVRELAALYQAAVTGAPVALPPLPIQYADYAIWQRGWLQGAVLETQLAYWRAHLGGELPALTLPTDYPRPLMQTFRSGRQALMLPKHLAESLKALSRNEGVTLFMTLLAAFQSLLARYTGQEDIIVGTPIANRTQTETEGLIGFFVNTLVLRTDLSGNPAFPELLQRVREVCLGAYTHQDLPFEQLVEALQIARDISRTPLFQVLFNMINVADVHIDKPGLNAAFLPAPDVGAKFDMTLYVQEQNAGINFELVYNADLFTPTRMAELLEQFQHLLGQVVRSPTQHIDQFSLVTPTAQMRLPNPRAAIEPSWDVALQTRFAQQARLAPERLAVADTLDAWTYQSLDIWSNRLANYLRASGIAAQDVVAIYGYRSAALVLALLGVLKAGAAFTILDPAHPAPRLIAQLRAAQPQGWLHIPAHMALPDALATFVTSWPWRCRLTLSGRAPAEAGSILMEYAVDDPQVRVAPDDLAYVAFTSGSMGEPKGILGTHRPLAHFLSWHQQTFGLNESDRFCMLSGLAHDPLLRDIFTPLWVGATLCIPDAEQLGTPDYLTEWMRQQAISVVHLTPALGQLLAEPARGTGAIPPEQVLASLRYAFFGGDILTMHDISRLRALAPTVTCVNFYGATETPQAIGYCIVANQKQSETHGSAIIPVGCGIQGAQLLVINQAQQLAGVGELGEIWVRTPYLASGYLRDIALTQERFVPNPFTLTPEDRLYKTGDLGRYLPDGQVEFVGRHDRQVKLRGFRIELGEIEATLTRHPAVWESRVLARADASGEQRLIAYVVTAKDERRKTNDVKRDPSFVQELRAFLKQQLPDYMLPADFVQLDALPLTPNGKIDWRALPAPDPASSKLAKTFVAPRTPIEELLADLWAQFFDVQAVGIHDNFFELGGHSLLATQCISRLRKLFHVEIPLRSLFEAPTVAGLAVLIARAQLADSALHQSPIARVPRERQLLQVSPQGVWKEGCIFPASFAQQRLWFLNQLEPNSPVYTIPQAIRMTGGVRVAALHQALDAMLARHESLRTTFMMQNGSLMQVVAEPEAAALPMIDLSTCPESDRETEMRRWIATDVQQPFDLALGPLLRTSLLRLGTAEHVLLLTMHHIITDGWSMGVFVRDLAALYAAFSAEAPVQLADLPIQYADFAQWQRQWLQGVVLERQLAYWRAQLAGAPAVLDLPNDRPRPMVRTFQGARHTFVLPPAASATLRALSQREGVSLFMALLAAFQILLARYTTQDDIVVGSPIAGRTQVEIEELIGFFANTLVLRTDLAGNPSVRELLERVRAVCLDAYAHQDLPFERLVEELQPVRDLGQTPLFQILFVLQNAPSAPLILPDLTLTPLEIDSGAAKFELTLMMQDTEQGLLGELEYNTALFDAATIARLASHFQTLLQGMVADSDRAAAALPLMTVEEREQVLVVWNQTQVAYPQALCLHELVAAHSDRTPDAIAIMFDFGDKETRRQGDKEATGRTTNDGSAFVLQPSAFNLQLTYSELNRRANQLAHHLRTLGVGPDVGVAIAMDRSLELVIGLLGILKAGGAFVPLDPSYPPARLAFMLDDARVSVLLTATNQDKETRTHGDKEIDQLLVSLPPCLGRVVDLRADWPLIAQAPADALANNARPDNLAYIIYTSGSTGQPKGAMNTHAAITNRLHWMQATYRLDPTDRVLQKTSTSFDVSVWEFFWPMITGAQLVLARPDGHKDSAYLVDLIATQQITTLHFVPTMLDVFLAEPTVARCTSLRRVICSGEQLSLALQQRFFSQLEAALHNLYGPTEAAVDVTYWDCERESNREVVPIGRPIANTQIYLLDAALHPVPIGVAGELYIGGVQLARGYLNRPDLTAERFVPKLFAALTPAAAAAPPLPRTGEGAGGEGTRLYRTGDQARWRPDGLIEYLGRSDQQVKLRGLRIELGEIATVLGQHSAVREAVVLAREDRPGDMRLVAYVVPTKDEGRKTKEEERDPSFVLRPSSFITDLRAFLQTRLPEYMIPAVFVPLATLPLTPNGKLDRRALPLPDGTRPELDEMFVPPRTPIEQILAAVWAEVLGIDQVGIHDNFFALGGDSMRSISVLALAQARGLRLTLPQLFQYQTIASLSQVYDPAAINAVAAPVRPFSLISEADRRLVASAVEDAYPLVTLQTGMLFHSEYSPDTAVYHDIFTLHLHTPLNVPALHAAIQQVVGRHAVLRTAFDLTRFSLPLQLVYQAVVVPLYVADLSELAPTAQPELLDAWIAEEKRRPFDWRSPPLLRFQVHRRSAETFQFTLSFHHAILDGWSVAALLTELFGIYLTQLGIADLPVAPPPQIAYRAFVALERQALESAECRQYWLQKLSGSTPTVLPRWPEQPNGATRKVVAQEVPLALAVSDGLRQMVRATGVPIKSMLLAAHLRVMHLLSSQSDVLTGMVTHGRPEAAGGERVLGLFLNTVPMRVQLAGGTWRELVRETFAAERELLPFRRYPLAEIQRALGGQPLFETAFNFNDFHVYQRLDGLKDLQLLDGQFLEETNFTLLANFGWDRSKSQIRLTLAYDATQLSSAQITAISGYYAKALAAIAQEPDERYELYTLLSAQERQQILVAWNTTATADQFNDCLHTLIADQRARTPDATAVVCGSAHLTYRELGARANQLAHYLGALGVGPEVPVALCMDRSLELLIGVLGILNAGGVYLPLDPTYPTQRLAFMLADSQAPVLLTATNLQDQETRTHGDKEIDQLLVSLPPCLGRVVDLRTDWPQIAQQPATAPDSGARPENLAYLIYTSGSTGAPKGAMNTHRAIVNRLRWMQATYRLTAADRVLHKTPTSFDVSVWELFWPLLSGAPMILALPGGHQDPRYLVALIAEQSITTLHFVPAMLRLFLAEPDVACCASLRRIICSGEALPAELMEQCLARLGAELHNLYGPTEAAVDVTAWACVPAHPRSSVPIGRPIANTQIYILDRALQPVPVGVPGELYIGGVQLARGYYRHPDMTAERFVPNPFAEVSGAGCQVLGAEPSDTRYPTPATRLYKTGDLARYWPDGVIEFLGRIDHQVKLRGLRIELGEIETVLAQHPSVEASVVSAREDLPGDLRLVAYVVPTKDERRKTSEERDLSFVLRPASFVDDLRTFLAARLPAYMLPSAFVLLEQLPLTPNGKIDRRALPVPTSDRPEMDAVFVAPRTHTEIVVASMLSEILVLERVGVYDSFFALGGHSLLAIQFISRLRDAFQLELPLRTLYESPTVAALAATILQKQAEQADADELEQMLTELDQLSDAEVQTLLAAGEGE